MISRRTLVIGGLALPFAARAQPLTCGKQTEPQTAGPFFKTDSPRRTSLLEKDFSGAKLVLTGRVLSPQCRPVANAKLDFWQADDRGAYDNKTHRYRGHQFTDAEGRYRLETAIPALYPGRTRHIHVKVQPSGGRTLTTQLYFPGEKANKLDFLYESALEMKMAGAGEGSFDFVVDA